MRTKDFFSPLFFIILGTAFLAISLWVWFSNGKNAKAIKAKYKLGGMILSLSFFTTTGCDPVITCYDPVPQDYVYAQKLYSDSIFVGDKINILIQGKTFQNYSFSLSDSTTTKVLQEGMLTINDISSEYELTINKNIPYIGKVKIDIFGEQTAEVKKTNLIFSMFFNLYAPQN